MPARLHFRGNRGVLDLTGGQPSRLLVGKNASEDACAPVQERSSHIVASIEVSSGVADDVSCCRHVGKLRQAQGAH